MKNKYVPFLFAIILLIFTYTSTIYPYLQKRNLTLELWKKWDINIDLKDKLIIAKKNKSQWHGEQQKFILFESYDINKAFNYINNLSLYQGKMDLSLREKILEIEDILNIDEKNRINFNSSYYYTMRIRNNLLPGTDRKRDILYIILIKEDNKFRIFFIEDLNVLALPI